MRIEFTAFAEDSVFSGNLDLEADRLSDVIAGDSSVEIRDVVIVALDDGRMVTTSAVTISRPDFTAITAAGPRGNPSLRVPTRRHSVRTRIGPYEVVGYLHAPPSAHTLAGVVRRHVIPLTAARIRYRLRSREIEQTVDTLLLNGDQVSWMDQATNGDLGLAGVRDVPMTFRPAKDFSGDLSS